LTGSHSVRGRVVRGYRKDLRKHGISTAVKPYKTLRNLLVHPKDKRRVGQRGECVYKIPYHNCSSTSIGETGRSYGKRQEEHRKKVESIGNRTLTRADRKDLAAETNKSAITDLAPKENHVIDWSGAKILDREGHQRTRQLKESIRIRREANCMNRDGRAYNLPTTYDCILVTRSSSTSRDHMSDEVRRWRTKRRNRYIFLRMVVSYAYNYRRRHSVARITPPRHTEIGTVSLPASSRYIGLNFPAPRRN